MNFSNLKMQQVNSPPVIAIYGAPGIGKTAFGIGADASTNYRVGKENHLLVNIDFRGGDRLVCNRATDMLGKPITSTDDLKQIFAALAETNHGIDWVTFDDLSSLEEMFVSEVCEENKVDELKKIEYGRGFELAKAKWFLFLAMIKDMQEMKNIGVILLGHTRIESIKDPMVEAYSRHDIQLDKRSKDIIKKGVDIIGFAHKKTYTKQVDEGFGKKGFVAVGNSVRLLDFSPNVEGFESKDRFNLPNEIELDWSKFQEALNNSIGLYNSTEQKTKKSKKGE